MSKILRAAKEVSFYVSAAVNEALYKVLYLPGHTFQLLLGKLQQVGQEVALLNLLCSCVWSDILEGVQKLIVPMASNCIACLMKTRLLRLANKKIYEHEIREWALS